MVAAISLEASLARLAGFTRPVSLEQSLSRLAGLNRPVSAEYAAAVWAGLNSHTSPPSLEYSLARKAGLTRPASREFLASLLAPAASSGAIFVPIALKQISAKAHSQTSPLSVSLPSPVTAGNFILVYVFGTVAFPDAPSIAISDNQGNTYSVGRVSFNGDVAPNGPGILAAIYHKRGVASNGGTFTVTATNSSGTTLAIVLCVAEYTGIVNAANVRDIALNEEGLWSGTPDPNVGPSAVMAQANELVVAAIAMRPTNSPVTISSYPAGFTSRVEENDNATYMFANGLDLIQQAPASFTASWTTNATVDVFADWASVLVSYRGN